MSSPARDARLLSIARGFTQVLSRGDSHIVTRNPINGKCAYDGQVGGGWHYNGNQETDTAWVTGVAPWNYQITKANYNLFALSQLNQGQLLKCLDPASGQSITFQPMALQWTNALNQIQQISMPRSVAAQVSDDVLYWPSGYGSGRHFKYVASPSRLNKLLIIDSAASLPATSYDVLELNFIIGMSAGVTPYIDSGSGLAAWNKITRKDTVKAIEFRLSNGNVVWSFAVPTAYDSSGTPDGSTTGTMRLKKQGSSLYVSVRFPKSWIDTAQFPITLDPTVDHQLGASADDGSWTDTTFSLNNITGIIFGRYSDDPTHTWARWTGVTIPNGATINSAYLSFYFASVEGTPPACTLYFEDAANPSAPTSIGNWNAKTKTTASISITGASRGTWWNSGSIISILEELLASNSYAAGAAMQMMVDGPAGSVTARSLNRAWNYSGNTYGPKLHIEYTEASTSSWAGTWGG